MSNEQLWVGKSLLTIYHKQYMKFAHIQQTFFFALLITTTGIFLWMLGTYLLPVLWGAVIAILFYPLYVWFRRTFGERAGLASLTTVLTIILAVFIPLTIIGGLIVQDSLELYQRITQNEQFERQSLLDRADEFLAYLEPYGISQDDVIGRAQEWIATISQTLSSSLVAVSQMTLTLAIQVAIMVYLLFFFFRDGATLRSQLLYYIPLEYKYGDRLLERFANTARAVVKGTLTIALLQGVIIGITFWLTGIASPVLWAVVVAILALIPALGPALIWLPAGIIMISTGALWSGVAILVVGAILVGLVDEFLRPILVGRGAQMPDAIILLATVGGLATFGISGFIIGPIIAAFFLSLWTIFGERYAKELAPKKTR